MVAAIVVVCIVQPELIPTAVAAASEWGGAIIAGFGEAAIIAEEYVAKAEPEVVKVTEDLASKAETEVAKVAEELVLKGLNNDIINLERVGTAASKTDAFHAFPNIVDNYAGLATKTNLSNATLYQLQGSLTINTGTFGEAVNYVGRFEWIVQAGQVTHRLFVEGGGMNGIPIMP